MLTFIAGMLCGAVFAVMILGFLVVAKEDREREEKAIMKRYHTSDERGSDGWR